MGKIIYSCGVELSTLYFLGLPIYFGQVDQYEEFKYTTSCFPPFLWFYLFVV